MKNHTVTTSDGDVHLDDESMTPAQAMNLAFRIVTAAQDAIRYRKGVMQTIAHAGEMMVHDSMRGQRPEDLQ